MILPAALRPFLPRKPAVPTLPQAALAIAGAAALTGLVLLVGEELARRGIPSGFAFLGRPAGFQVSESLFAVAPADSYAWALLAGLANTVQVAVLAATLATGFGILLGALRLADHPLPARAAAAYVELFRNTPVLLQLFLWYGLLTELLPGVRQAWSPLPGVHLSNRGLFLPSPGLPPAALAVVAGALLAALLLWRRSGRTALALAALAAAVAAWQAVPVLPVLRGFNFEGGVTLSPECTALLVGLALFHASYIAEIVRAGLAAVPQGQVDAAKALGLGRLLRFRLVVLPQVRRYALPPLANQYVALLKNSSLAVAIGFPDLVSIVNTTINQTGQAIEGVALIVVAYLALGALIGWAMARADGRLALAGSLDAAQAAPVRRTDRKAWLGTPARILVTVLTAGLLAAVAWRLVDWAVLRAVWTGGPDACRAATGACWAVIGEKWRLMLFGPYPVAGQWRPALASLLLVAGLAAAAGLRRGPLLLVAAVVAAWILMAGDGLLLPTIDSSRWGGLPVSLGLALGALLLSLPLALVLALARQSQRPVPRTLATAVIETVRGIPLVSLLFAVAVLVPLLLPGDWSSRKLLLGLIGLTLLSAAYLAEVLRGALQAIPPAQAEAARALGLGRWATLRLVLLPQALRLAAPAGVGTFIGTVKDTSLVLVIGLFDLFHTTKAAIADPAWRRQSTEAYLAVALFYFLACFALSRWSRRLERPLATQGKRP